MAGAATDVADVLPIQQQRCHDRMVTTADPAPDKDRARPDGYRSAER